MAFRLRIQGSGKSALTRATRPAPEPQTASPPAEYATLPPHESMTGGAAVGRMYSRVSRPMSSNSAARGPGFTRLPRYNPDASGDFGADKRSFRRLAGACAPQNDRQAWTHPCLPARWLRIRMWGRRGGAASGCWGRRAKPTQPLIGLCGRGSCRPAARCSQGAESQRRPKDYTAAQGERSHVG